MKSPVPYLAVLLVLIASDSVIAQPTNLVTVPGIHLRHPAGFRFTQFATANWAHEIRAMTLDSQGRVVVSGRGWIRRLDDTDNDGRADKAVEVAAPTGEATGMVYVGNDLYALVDGAFCRYLDSDGDGVADGVPQRFFEFGTGPEGAQALRRGPDSSWYILTGPFSGLGQTHWNFPGSPIRRPDAGAIVQISPDLSRSQVIAQGFRHAADFDFHPTGPLLTYDRGDLREAFLPWQVFPRLFQVAHGGHHGWRYSGHDESWSLPDYHPALVPPAWSANRLDPAATIFYRHHQFPVSYRGGLLIADREHGALWGADVKPHLTGMTVAMNPLIESTGRNGWMPTALEVGPDGSLYIATEGRGTAGGVFRLQYVRTDPATGKLADQPQPFVSPFDSVLRAPQRLAAWSRQQWMPLSLQTGRLPYEQVVMNISDPEELKLVALDTLVEMYGGLTQREANITAKSVFASVRARTAWSLGRYPFPGYLVILQELLRDEAPMVRRAALEVYRDHASQLPPAELLRVAALHLGHEDQRVRMAAIELTARLPENEWQTLLSGTPKSPALARLAAGRAALLRQPAAEQPQPVALREALAVLRVPEKGTPELGIMALTLVQDAFGGLHPRTPMATATSACETRLNPLDHPAAAAEVLTVIRPLFPTGHPLVDAELARTLAIMGDSHADTPARMLGAFGVQSAAASDIHYLACLARLNPGAATPGLTNLVEVFLWLDNKIGETGNAPGLHWKQRVVELATELMKRHPDIGLTLMGHPGFPEPEHAYLAPALGEPRINFARDRFMEAADGFPAARWNPELIKLLAGKPSEKLFTGLRALWSRPELHEAIVQALARAPEEVDRTRFVAALTSTDPRTLTAALEALTSLADPAPQVALPAVMRVLYQAAHRTEQSQVRQAAIAWLKKHAGLAYEPEESYADRRSLELIYRPVFQWFITRHPAETVALSGMDADTFRYWEQAINEAPWINGKWDRGAAAFQKGRCAECHGSGSGLGPSLAGVGSRLSPAGIMRTIVFPHLDVPPGAELLRATMRDGQQYTGVVVLDTPETLILHESKGESSGWETIRLPQAEVVNRELTRESSMPVGLLKGFNARDLADLNAYLQTL